MTAATPVDLLNIQLLSGKGLSCCHVPSPLNHYQAGLYQIPALASKRCGSGLS
jgi:hypothetical protein